MLELESAHLHLREAAKSDLPALLPVYLTNPQFLRWSNLPDYDLASLLRDWEEVQKTPGRFLLGIYRKDTGEAVGTADFLEQNPDDGLPWLGLLIIHRVQQGQGLGREAYRRLAEHFRTDRDWQVLRLGVLRENRSALAFWRRLGFSPVAGGDATGRTICRECDLRDEACLPAVKRKVFAYITRGDHLLVFRHPDALEAGIQVPAGTVEEGEDPATAVVREAIEETGLTSLTLRSFLGKQERDMADFGRDEIHERRFYHVQCTDSPPPTWRHHELHPSDGTTEPITFEFFWVRLPDEVPDLIADQGAMLPWLLGELGLVRLVRGDADA